MQHAHVLLRETEVACQAPLQVVQGRDALREHHRALWGRLAHPDRVQVGDERVVLAAVVGGGLVEFGESGQCVRLGSLRSCGGGTKRGPARGDGLVECRRRREERLGERPWKQRRDLPRVGAGTMLGMQPDIGQLLGHGVLGG